MCVLLNLIKPCLKVHAFIGCQNSTSKPEAWTIKTFIKVIQIGGNKLVRFKGHAVPTLSNIWRLGKSIVINLWVQ
jgi:hypothetical protein